MSKFSNTLARIANIIAESTQPLIDEADKFVNDFDFDKAFDDVVSKQRELVEQGKKWFDDFNQFIVDIQNKVKTYDFFVNYDEEKDMDPVIEYGEDGSIKVTVISKDETCCEQVTRRFPIKVEKEHVIQRYDSDAKKLYFTVGIGEPAPKEDEKTEEETNEGEGEDPTPHQTCENGTCEGRQENRSKDANADETFERLAKAASKIFNAAPRRSGTDVRFRH